MRRIHPLVLLASVALVLAAGPWQRRATRITYHDNDRPSGRIVGDELQLAFSIVEGAWHINGEDRPGARLLAFADEQGGPTLPGPLIRVPVGTKLAVTVTNTTDSVLVLRGISTDPADSLLLPPGATGTARGVADRAGNRYYDLGYLGQDATARRVEDGHLAGALIVDAAESGSAPEHVLLLTSSFHFRDSTGRLTRSREIFAINGRPWPQTKRYTGTVGDTMRFRVLNASEDGHPMHLHGSFFRVEARGLSRRDAALAPRDQRMVVTEFMEPGTTMTMAWAPDRPGGWLMHCHLTFHVVTNIKFGADSLDDDAAFREVLMGHEGSHPDHHVEEGMGGLMTAIEVAVPAGWTAPTVARREVRFEIGSDSVAGEPFPRLSPTIRAANGVEVPLGPAGPGGLLLLREGEPTRVRVINPSGEHTAVHWHGMELESYFDGVVGIGGVPSQRTTAVAPRDSFDALMTPPRPGTFIYHTHFLEVKQGVQGLFGAMLVLPRNGRWDPAHDHYFIAGPTVARPSLNGDTLLAPMEWIAGSEHRLRLINITAANPRLVYRLARVGDGGDTQEWTHVAKDGWDLPPHQRRTVSARQHVSMGETYDVLVRLREPGTYRLTLESGDGRRVAGIQPITVVPR